MRAVSFFVCIICMQTLRTEPITSKYSYILSSILSMTRRGYLLSVKPAAS